jgi:hypothetical protein
MHRGMQWPEPRLTWPDGKLVCCTFRVAYEAFRESDAAGGLLAVTTLLGRILGIDPTGSLRPGAKVVVSIRPEDLSTRATAADAVNAIEGRMTFAAFAGAAVEAELRCGETIIACLLDRDVDLTPGRTVTLRAKPDACLVLPEE